MRPAKMTQGSNARSGIAAGRAAAGANVEAVMSNSLGYRVPVQERLRRGKGLTLGRNDRSQWRDRAGLAPASTRDARFHITSLGGAVNRAPGCAPVDRVRERLTYPA